MIFETELVLLPDETGDETLLKELAARQLKLSLHQLHTVKILKRSIDARGKQPVYRLKVQAFVNEEPVAEVRSSGFIQVSSKKPVIIVGAGPAGLFAAIRCLEAGLKPIILERGKKVKERRRDLAAINKEGIVDPDSNYCFGEGGAGTYSDGKLYTRSNKRGDIQKVLQVFIDHGASPDIGIDARPHIGTNKLPGIITAIRETILEYGGEIHFGERVTALIIRDGKIKGVKTSVSEAEAGAVILATGHSARDIYYMLHSCGLLLEPKPFALGVRIEHPQEIIDRAQYHCDSRPERLPPSYYSLVEQVDQRGVFSFCMCPGGIIAPCATDSGEVVVNGWSPSRRNNPFANSGTVVQVTLNDLPPGSDSPLRLLEFQQEIERAAWRAGGGLQTAPAQRMVDFVNDRFSSTLPSNSYLPGVQSAMLDEILPEFISQRLKKALPVFGKKMKGYYTNEAILVGVESRTSSPVRIPRGQDYQHPQVSGLFPCGEGAGYAGGIVSAAIDGMNCVDAAAKYMTI
jgi:uncharacterized FAD-dependent dehydrogenase